ncbi:unnamed protein product [Leuciscus chuanchicus]
MPNLPNLNSFGKLCGTGRSDDSVVLDRVKRKNSVRRMSIIEDGNVAEVLYLIPKQSMMEQLPFLNPNDYVILEKMAPLDMGPEFKVVSQTGRDYGCGICICHTRQLQPGYFRRARAESTNTHTYTRGGIKQKPRKILLVRAPADTEEPMVMVKEKGSMALHSTGWGPGERAHAEGENQASVWEICVHVGCRD